MPVTHDLTDHRAKSNPVQPLTPRQILENLSCQSQAADSALRYCIGQWTGLMDPQIKAIPTGNGFVKTVVAAYKSGSALVLRPDHVWLAIISQFRLYLHARPELLEVSAADSSIAVGKRCDSGSQLFPNEIDKFLRTSSDPDPALREWIVPTFSTSTDGDRAVALTMLHAAAKSAPIPISLPVGEIQTRHGIPRVMLEGVRGDWDLLLVKLERLKDYGTPAIAWYHLLSPIITRLAESFEGPNTHRMQDFWKWVIHREGHGGKDPHLSGWITAFCVFSAEGIWCGPELSQLVFPNRKGESRKLSLHERNSRLFWQKHSALAEHEFKEEKEMRYPYFTIHNLPISYAEVQLTTSQSGVDAQSFIVAGLAGVGFSSSISSTDLQANSGKNDTVRPVVAWWVFHKLSTPRSKTAEDDEPLPIPSQFIAV
ncbi:hypothetical protein R3P38DRAFT_3218970 [Favolaschia claudopus]|uniref:Uncharacterized protein n=1 Tax=Favolaschia claudopus TaxID=2862362 RepID=A0AAW0A4I0_9AGAR